MFRAIAILICVAALPTNSEAAPARRPPPPATAAPRIVTLYCEVEFKKDQIVTTGRNPIFTVNFDTAEIYVSAGLRSGELFKAKVITEGVIELPDFTEATLVGQIYGIGYERISRTTGAYSMNLVRQLPSSFGRPGPVIYHSGYGTCQPGALVPFPARRF